MLCNIILCSTFLHIRHNIFDRTTFRELLLQLQLEVTLCLLACLLCNMKELYCVSL
jgi:hypothetical protein